MMVYDLDAFINLMGLKLLPYQRLFLEHVVNNKNNKIVYITSRSPNVLGIYEHLPMPNNSEWWTNECGGMFCSNCGHFHDDYFEHPPSICPECKSYMITHDEMYVDKDYRLSSIHSGYYIDESEYPNWLLKLKKEK